MKVTGAHNIALLPTRSPRQDKLQEMAARAGLEVTWFDLAEGGCSIRIASVRGQVIHAHAYRRPRTGRIVHYCSITDGGVSTTITLAQAESTIRIWADKDESA